MSCSSPSLSSQLERDTAPGRSADLSELELHDTPLTEDVVQASLSVLSHNGDGNLVYGRADLSSRCLSSITVLSAYRYLQRVSLDNNELHSLEPLRELYFLVYLSAANNKLDAAVFDDLASSATTLERLNLSGNALTSLNGLRKLRFLIDFTAAHNHIEEIDCNDWTALHSLTRLNLAFNYIGRIHVDAFAGCNTLRCLDLSNNKVVNTEFVLHLAGNLESLLLDHNSVERLSGFHVLQSLVCLHLANNRIADWEELNTLTDLMNLRQLTLEHNPLFEPPISVTTSDLAHPPGSSLPSYTSDAKVAQDVDFVNGRIINPQSERLGACYVNTMDISHSFGSGGGGDAALADKVDSCDGESDSRNTSKGKIDTVLNSVLLSTIAAPPARGLVQHLPMAPQELSGWNDNSQQELEQLSQYERNRFRVISVASQVACLDSVPVTPEEIQRAKRLFRNCNRNGNCFASGSAVRAVETQRQNISHNMM